LIHFYKRHGVMHHSQLRGDGITKSFCTSTETSSEEGDVF